MTSAVDSYENIQVTKAYSVVASGETDALPLEVEEGDGVYRRTGVKQEWCCGCDMRRAVMIVDSLNAALLLPLIIMLLLARFVPDSSLNDNPDDRPPYWLIAVPLIKLGTDVLGIYGAITYNVCMVGITGTSYYLEAILAFFGLVAYFPLSLFSVTPFYLISALFFAHPHFCFMDEVKRGIMTEENCPINDEAYDV
jgi:hypothetical protein